MSDARWTWRVALLRSSRRRLALLTCLVLLGACVVEGWRAGDSFAASESGGSSSSTAPTDGNSANGGSGGTGTQVTTDGQAPGQPPAYTVSKSVSGTAAPGHKLTYTVKVHVNADTASAGFTDDLGQVLDDATYDKDAKASAGTVNDTTEPGVISWAGSDLMAGQDVSVSYSVTVNDPDTGDGVLINGVEVLGDSGGQCQTCFITSAVHGDFTVHESSSPKAGATLHPGDIVHYTITVTGGHAPANPAGFTDTIPSALHYGGDARANAGDLSIDGRRLAWESSLKPGDRATVTFSATVVAGAAGHDVVNSVTPATTDHSSGSCVGSGACRVSHPVAAAPGAAAPSQSTAPPPTAGNSPSGPGTHRAGVEPVNTSLPGIANTGAHTATIGSFGVALLLSGAGVLGIARRPRRARHG